MDTYDLYHEMQKLWAENSEKNSGELYKSYQHVPTIIWTPDGYREVIGIKWNKDIKAIELILDRE